MSNERMLGEPFEPNEDEAIVPQWKEPGAADEHVREAACEDEPVTEEEQENEGTSQ